MADTAKIDLGVDAFLRGRRGGTDGGSYATGGQS